ncbi:MAG: hypothetical protein IJ379_00185 [Lachnospiraceae bacterium]|nr:hypothetical protein [Lachnospiraceae bacterium]
MELKFPKLYRYDRIAEHCNIAIPVAKGVMQNADSVQIFQEGKVVPSQKKVTSRHADGSIRYLFVRFMADLPGNKGTVLECNMNSEERSDFEGIRVEEKENGYVVRAGVEFSVSDYATTLFDWLKTDSQEYSGRQFVGPFLEDGDGYQYGVKLEKWQVMETGPLVAVLRCKGECTGNKPVRFEMKLTAYAGKPWIEISYRIINTTDEPLHIASLVFAVLAEEDAEYDASLVRTQNLVKLDSTGCGDANQSEKDEGPIYETTGILKLPQLQEKIDVQNVRTCVGNSNYKTKFSIGRDGEAVDRIVDAKYLVGEANEHFAEVIYGTFFADRTDSRGGVCATIYQAQQNYPKAVKADKSGVYVMLVPKDVDKVVMESGMSREQRFQLHFHTAQESLLELDNRSLIYQMPDRPHIAPEIFKEANVMPDIFVDRDKINYDVELSLIGKCDGHARSYGMLNWGDSPDPGYTTQGRGNGLPVWTNNEYDYPHACALFYARTGERRFLDYMLVACSHWMDVDVCHYSQNPLHLGGQWEHTGGHCKDGVMVCSHEWVEGLLDYYHFSGDERGLETALGIGDNVLRLLDTPMYQKSGESSARETGWALRTLVALYIETNDDKWLCKCDWILGHFKEWTQEYGDWVAPYLDNTTIRVGFMISVAVGSIMRYYRLFPSEEIKQMMLQAVDDVVENCFMETGVFSYKELPSLNRIGSNTLLLEAMTIAYELSGDTKYLTYGKRTFWNSIHASAPGVTGVKSIVEDAVIHKTTGTKNFAQSFIPLSVYYKALADNNML